MGGWIVMGRGLESIASGTLFFKNFCLYFKFIYYCVVEAEDNVQDMVLLFHQRGFWG